jgi:hypothetical protein
MAVPEFDFKKLAESDKEETLRLIEWIFNATASNTSQTLAPSLFWCQNLGVLPTDVKPVVSIATIAALAREFGLTGEPLDAFHIVGIDLPRDPNAAVTTLYNAVAGRCPSEIRLDHDDITLAKLHQIQIDADELSLFDHASLILQKSRFVAALQSANQLRRDLRNIRAIEALQRRTDEALKPALFNLWKLLLSLEPLSKGEE